MTAWEISAQRHDGAEAPLCEDIAARRPAVRERNLEKRKPVPGLIQINPEPAFYAVFFSAEYNAAVSEKALQSFYNPFFIKNQFEKNQFYQ